MRKTCKRCGEDKQIYLFYKNRQSKDGCHNYCKACKADIHKKYLEDETVRQKVIKTSMQWQKDNHEQYLIHKRKYDASAKRTEWRRNKYNHKPRIFKNKENKFPFHEGGTKCKTNL